MVIEIRCQARQIDQPENVTSQYSLDPALHSDRPINRIETVFHCGFSQVHFCTEVFVRVPLSDQPKDPQVHFVQASIGWLLAFVLQPALATAKVVGISGVAYSVLSNRPLGRNLILYQFSSKATAITDCQRLPNDHRSAISEVEAPVLT